MNKGLTVGLKSFKIDYILSGGRKKTAGEILSSQLILYFSEAAKQFV